MARCRKLPIVIEAVQWTGENYEEIKQFAGESFICWHYNHDSISIQTLEGVMSASKGDWIIKGIKNEFYPCKPDVFEKTYEKEQ